MGNIKNVNGVNIEMTAEEIAEIQAVSDSNLSPTEMLKYLKREARDGLLAETDWMANSDVTMTDAWKTYRQALRDLPSVSGFPDVNFPTKPE